MQWNILQAEEIDPLIYAVYRDQLPQGITEPRTILNYFDVKCKNEAVRLIQKSNYVVAGVKTDRQENGRIVYKVNCLPDFESHEEVDINHNYYEKIAYRRGLYRQEYSELDVGDCATIVGAHDPWFEVIEMDSITLDGVVFPSTLGCIANEFFTDFSSTIASSFARRVLPENNLLNHDLVGTTLQPRQVLAARSRFLSQRVEAAATSTFHSQWNEDIRKTLISDHSAPMLVIKSCAAAARDGVFESDQFLNHTAGFEVSAECEREIDLEDFSLDSGEENILARAGRGALGNRIFSQLAQSHVQLYKGPFRFLRRIQLPYKHLKILDLSPRNPHMAMPMSLARSNEMIAYLNPALFPNVEAVDLSYLQLKTSQIGALTTRMAQVIYWNIRGNAQIFHFAHR